MKKSLLLSLLLAFLCAFSVSAKKSNTIKCELILNDGKKVEGWLVKEKSASYGLYMVKNATDVVVASSAESKDGTNYNADDVKEMKLTDEASGESLVYKSLHAVKSFTMPKSMSPSPKRYFWLVMYEGKKVTGYISTATTRVITSVRLSTRQLVNLLSRQLVNLLSRQLVNSSTPQLNKGLVKQASYVTSLLGVSS